MDRCNLGSRWCWSKLSVIDPGGVVLPIPIRIFLLGRNALAALSCFTVLWPLNPRTQLPLRNLGCRSDIDAEHTTARHDDYVRSEQPLVSPSTCGNLILGRWRRRSTVGEPHASTHPSVQRPETKDTSGWTDTFCAGDWLNVRTLGLISYLVLAILLLSGVFATPQLVKEWDKTYGGPYASGATWMVQSPDGGYALVGWIESYGAGNTDFWLVKTDSQGNQEWNKTYGGAGSDVARSMVYTRDGGYALAGGTLSYGAGGSDFWLVKTDSQGNQEWSKTYGGPGGDVAKLVIKTQDGGYALAGMTQSFGAGGAAFWLVKVAERNETLTLILIVGIAIIAARKASPMTPHV